MKLATKTTPWMVASLLAVTSIFGQNQKDNQGACVPQQCVPQPPVCKPAKCCVPQVPQEPTICAYNAPAEINVGCQGDIDFFASASFIYWQSIQDNMSIGLTDNNAIFTGSAQVPSIQGSFIEMDFDYQPGFKVGLGMNLQIDDWDGYAEYTRVHGTQSSFSSGPFATPSIFPTRGHPIMFPSANVFNTVYGSYRNNLDFFDVEMGRAYYVGKSLLFRPAFGARGAWILQNAHVEYDNNQASATFANFGAFASSPSVVDVYQRCHSWGIGPRAGVIMDWMLGWGTRFFGSGYADVLYTKYKVQDKSVIMPRANLGTAFLIGNPVSFVTFDKVSSLRAHLDFEIGLGWGSYFDKNNWHVDLSASYGWQVFFDQNMFRHFDGYTNNIANTNSALVVASNIIPNGNLYVQGLTVTARLDF